MSAQMQHGDPQPGAVIGAVLPPARGAGQAVLTSRIQSELRCFLTDRTARLNWILAFLAVALAIFSIASTGVVAYLSHSTVPFQDHWDYWRTEPLLQTDPMAFFFSQHNEHRIAFTRLFLLADHVWFGGHSGWVLAFIAGMQLASGLLIWRMSGVNRTLSRSYRAFSLGLIISMLFAAQQFDNFTWPFQVGFVAAYAGALGAFACLRMCSIRSGMAGWAWLILSMICALAATYSLAIGLFLWGFLVGLALMLRISRTRVMTLTVCAAFVIGTYLTGYASPPHHADPIQSLTQLHKVLAFTFTYLGAPIDDFVYSAMLAFNVGTEGSRLLYSGAAGLVGLVTAGWFTLRAMTRGRRAGSGELVLVHMLLFLTASAFMTGLGRVNFSTSAALASRYATPAVMFWSCLLGIVIGRHNPGLRRAHLRVSRTMWILTCVVMLLFAANHLPRIRYAREYNAQLLPGRTSLAVGVYDAEQWRKIYHSHHLMIKPLAKMRQEKVAVGSDPLLSLIGKPLLERFKRAPEDTDAATPAQVAATGTPEAEYDTSVSSPPAKRPWDRGACFGNVDGMVGTQSSFLSGHRLSGWAWEVKAKRSPETILLVDEANTIQGFGVSGVLRPDVHAAEDRVKTEFSGWNAYAVGNHHATLSAVGVLADGTHVCRLGRVEVNEIFTDWPLEKTGKVVSQMPIQMTQAWHYDTDVRNQPTPNIRTLLTSAGQRSTGVLELGPFETKGAVALGLPLRTGKQTDRLRVEIRDADTGMVLNSLAPPPVLEGWRVWRIDLLSVPDLRIRVIVTDSGEGDEEWLTVSLPRKLL